MEENIIKYLIENSTFIKNNLMNKIDEQFNVMMIVFIILKEEDLEKKQRNCILLARYINKNTKEIKINDDHDFLSVLSTINTFAIKAYGNNIEIIKITEKINSYANYLVNSEKRIRFRIS